MSHDIKKLCREHWDEIAEVLLETPHWPAGIEVDERYTRFDDDTRKGHIALLISNDGDAWLDLLSQLDEEDPYSHRFRMPMIGGGQSPRVRQALLILALAIKKDNEEHPQHR